MNIGRPWIRCHVCQKLVDQVESTRDLVTGEMTFTVSCHGAQQTAKLSHDDLITSTEIRILEAFSPARIETQNLQP